MVDIGRRVVVSGPTGSGKSTTAARLARCLGVPHIEVDAIHWLPGWVEKEIDEFRTDVQEALDACPDGWVCDGNYSKVRDLTLLRADAVVWLRLPLRVASWRLLKRTLGRTLRREQLWGTNYESLRLSFLSRDSLLLYQLKAWRGHHRKTQKALDELPHQATVYELRSPRQVEAFLEAVCAGAVETT